MNAIFSSIQRRSLSDLSEDTFFLGSWDRRVFEECLKGLLYPLKSPASLWHLRKHYGHCARAKSSSSGCHGTPSACLLWVKQPAASFTGDFGHSPQMQDAATVLSGKWLPQAQHSKQLIAFQSACRGNKSWEKAYIFFLLILWLWLLLFQYFPAPLLFCLKIGIGRAWCFESHRYSLLVSFFRHVFSLENADCVWVTENGILSNFSIWIYELDRNWLQTCHCNASHCTEWL